MNGSGLGLALSKRISEAMGGTLTLIWSEPRKGSHFLFQVPFEAVNGSQPVRRDSPTRRQSVLLAEDSPDNAFLISHFIESLGYSVHVVSDGVEAVEATRKTEYDTIVMDIQMPRMDGLEATRRIRAHGFKKSIIAVTAHALPEEVERSLAAGCDQHLTKPVSRADLAEALGV